MQENNKDCLVQMDIHAMNSDGTSNHDNCMVWCNGNDNCAGFTVWCNRCFFKNLSCENDIVDGDNTLYIKQGRFKLLQEQQ